MYASKLAGTVWLLMKDHREYAVQDQTKLYFRARYYVLGNVYGIVDRRIFSIEDYDLLEFQNLLADQK